MSLKNLKENKNPQYLKINSNPKFELLSENDYAKEINNLPKIYNENINLSEEKITKFFNIILPENKEEDILKINFAFSSGCKKNKDISHKCLNEIMNMEENIELRLSKEFASKLSYIIKEIFRRLKKYSSIKTYDDLLKNVKEFIHQGGNIINKYMIEKNYLSKKTLFERSENNVVIIDNKRFNSISSELPKYKKNVNNKKLEFIFKDIK